MTKRDIFVEKLKHPYTTIIHIRCDKPAFYYYGPCRDGEAVESRFALLLDGNRPSSDDRMVCGSCGAYISAWECRPK